ncbi:LysR substrate-binding domain-containing protein [Vogesella facilis]|uniref:LysR substrate-binding domain-containing protein n=1 Tax=Vogesella facilis TaxID=1655232 RepID=A0ABV7RCB2_9NEIS
MKAAGEKTRGYRRLIPSMTALVEFEAVARLSSFTVAAHELGVTQAAVSRQVKALEETLGVQLFHRLHRAIRLTREGEALYQVVSESMQKIAGVFDRLAKYPQQQQIIIATTAAFSQFRLLPRLAQLRQRLPQLQLRLTTQMFTADLLHKDVDVAIRFGSGKWQAGTAALLFDEEVFPVCAPGWLQAHPVPASLAELADMALIESDTTSEGWMGWEEWFAAVGYRPQYLHYAFRCSLYTDAVQAALAGQGLILGWGRLVHDLLATGELVRLPVASLKVTDSYYVVVPQGRTVSPVVEELIACLREDLTNN